jgi:Trk-type K+ transport system membrane component
MEMQAHLNSIAKWGKFLGYLYIIFGAIDAILGLFAFIIGAIPGVIMIFLGIFLLRTGKEAENLLQEYDERPLTEMLNNIAKYFKVMGILMIIGIVFAIIAIILAFTGAFFMEDLLNSMTY